VITLFSVRPHGFNIGNDTIFLGLRHLLREAFDGLVNIVQVPAVGSDGELHGLEARTVHDMNLYGHGVVIGGGNVYENGQLTVDTNALRALHPPLMLFSLSSGRIYDNRHVLVRRTDAMPDAIVTALHERAAISLARDEATLDYLRSLGLTSPMLGGCPSLLIREVATPQPDLTAPANGCLLSIRHPRLMSIPLSHQARLHATIVDLMKALEADGFGPVRILCHDIRDVAFASSLGDVEYILADDVHSHLAVLRRAPLVVSFRLHAFLPCVSMGIPAINISYDERSLSLVRTIGMESWDIDLVRSDDVVADVRDRCRRLDELNTLREAAQPRWSELIATMRAQMATFAQMVKAYAV
jgi:hypothetical protein